MEIPEFESEGCTCKKECCSFVEPMEHCVHFMARLGHDMRVLKCKTCGHCCWHRNGVCRRCEEQDLTKTN